MKEASPTPILKTIILLHQVSDRDIVTRGHIIDLAPQTIGLTICCVIILALSATRFRKQVA